MRAALCDAGDRGRRFPGVRARPAGLAAALLVLLTPPGMLAADSTSMVASGVVVLRNGQVLRGHVAHLGTDCLVALAEGGEVRLQRDEIELVANNLHDAYTHKAARVPARDVRRQLDLAEWCLRHALWERAAQQLSHVRRLGTDDPRLAVLETRLAATQPAPARTPPPPSASPPALLTPGAASPVPVAPSAGSPSLLGDAAASRGTALDAPAFGVRPAAHLAITSQGRSSAAPRLAGGGDAAGPRSIPLEQFTQAVQPLLLNRCATAACHGSVARSTYRLARAPWNGPMTHRLTHQNLEATLEYVDGEQPRNSPLLTLPLGHGHPLIFRGHPADEQQYRQLAAWVLEASGHSPGPPAVPAPAPAPEGAVIAGPTAPEGGVTALRAFSAASTAYDDTTERAAAGPAPGAEQDAAGIPPVQRPGAGAPSVTPGPQPVATAPLADPFDPAAFNALFTAPAVSPRDPPPDRPR